MLIKIITFVTMNKRAINKITLVDDTKQMTTKYLKILNNDSSEKTANLLATDLDIDEYDRDLVVEMFRYSELNLQTDLVIMVGTIMHVLIKSIQMKFLNIMINHIPIKII